MAILMLITVTTLIGHSLSQSVPPSTPTIDINRHPPQPQETICGDIVNDYLDTGNIYNFATDAFQCLTSVPFNAAVATRYIKYLNTTYQFLPYTAYLRNPPSSYQQPPVDLFGALDQIQTNINNGVYNNQYAFEWAVQQTIQQLHDSHTQVYGGIVSTMSFFSPYNLVSVSSDGKELPKIYVYEDLAEKVMGQDVNASPILRINDMDPVEYLKEFAARQSFGMLEPNADFNQLMYSPAQELFGLSSFSDAAPFYNEATIRLEFENGTSVKNDWYAIYESPGYTGPLATGGDYYNFFVLGLVPSNYAEEAKAYYSMPNPIQNSTQDSSQDSDDSIVLAGGNTTNDQTTSWNDVNPAYPANTIMHQANLGQFSSGSLTGYYISDRSTAVFSLPTFAEASSGIGSFNQALDDFIESAVALKAKKIIIDLQQNSGGSVAQAFDVYNQFFPNQRPFAGSRMRSQHLADLLGSTFTPEFEAAKNDSPDLNDDNYLNLLASEWVVTDRINAQTGRNFTSWDQYYGPLTYNNDTFSLTQQYDLSSQLFLEAEFGASFSNPCFYNQTCLNTQRWSASDIVMLTDGTCASACSLFVEAMQSVGVRSVVVGGIPQDGPMQTASGTRAAAEYNGDDLLDDFNQTAAWNSSVPIDYLQILSDPGMALVYSGLSLRDQIRQNQTIPNQMLYLPADCRLFWTLANFYNYTQLWMDVHDAMYVDTSRCVAGSTNVTSPPPAAASGPSTEVGSHEGLSYYITHPDLLGNFEPSIEGLTDGPAQQDFQVCYAYDDESGACHDVDVPCKGPCTGVECATSDEREFSIPTRTCYNNNNNACNRGVECIQEAHVANTGLRNSIHFKGPATRGSCRPIWSYIRANTRCSALDDTKFESIINSKWGI